MRRFFDAAQEASVRAARAAGGFRHVVFRLGRSTLALEFAGDAMADALAPAFRHLPAAEPGGADVTVQVWDSASTGVPMPPSIWGPGDFLRRAEVRGAEGEEEGIRVSFQAGAGMLSLLDLDRRSGMVWMRDAAECPYYEKAAPMRALLHWWFSALGGQLVHGAAVGTGRGAVLLAGPGGSGKSTTALAAVRAGLDFLGDDYVLCAAGADGAEVSTLYCTAKGDARTLSLLPEFAGAVVHPAGPEEKAVLDLSGRFAGRLPASRRLRAIVVPRVGAGAETELEPVTPGAAFLALAPTTVFQLPGAGRSATAFMRDLVQRVPCYRMRLGRDLAGPPERLRRLIDEGG